MSHLAKKINNKRESDDELEDEKENQQLLEKSDEYPKYYDENEFWCATIRVDKVDFPRLDKELLDEVSYTKFVSECKNAGFGYYDQWRQQMENDGTVRDLLSGGMVEHYKDREKAK